VAVAREPIPSRSVGPRTAGGCSTASEREVDASGACIGARGSRIQQVVNELPREKIET